jgi:putative heme-binding domain-containing protein
LSSASASDLAAGRKIFESQCAWCHGNEGTGGMGPDLRRSTLRHAATDAELATIVRTGIPGSEMPSLANALTEHAAWQTAAYVRSLSRAAPRQAPGDVRHGAALFESAGCAACHVVNGTGGTLGPELTAIGALRGPTYLRESIVKPEAAHPTGYLVVRAQTNAGQTIRGIRVNEDVFWVHIRDSGGTVHVLEKSSLASLERELTGTLMPSYASRLSAGELDDMVAYLATLRGAR